MYLLVVACCFSLSFYVTPILNPNSKLSKRLQSSEREHDFSIRDEPSRSFSHMKNHPKLARVATNEQDQCGKCQQSLLDHRMNKIARPRMQLTTTSEKPKQTPCFAPSGQQQQQQQQHKKQIKTLLLYFITSIYQLNVLKMKFSIIAFFGLMANLATTAQAIELTADNYDVETEGKTAMIKFFAPW